jgi:hypothetical protein
MRKLLLLLALSAASFAYAQPINYGGGSAGTGGGGSCTGAFCAASAPLAANLGGNGLDNSGATGFALWTAGVQSILTSQGNGSKVQRSTGTTTTNNCVKFDANGNTVDAGAACGTGSGLTVGTTAIGSGTSGRILYDNAGVLGELAVSGTGSVVLNTNSTIAGLTVTGSFTATGLVANAALVNSAITIGGASTALGGTVTTTTMLDSIASTQGTILYRNGSNWVGLAPGTSGQILQSGGAAANPSWTTAAGGGNTTISPASGNTADNAVCMSNTTTTIKDCGYAIQPSAVLAKSGNFTLTAAQWLNQDPVQMTATGTETFPAVSTLSANGVQLLQNASQSAVITITPNAVDQVCITGSACASANTPVALSAGFGAWITVATNKIYVTPIPYASGAGTVTSVAQSFTGGLISVSGSPVTTTGTLALTVAGTSGGIPYFSSSSAWTSSAALTANLPVIGGGAGSAPTVGTRSGNTTQFVTTTGTLTSGDCVKIDASGNFIANGSACGSGGGSTVVPNFITGLILSNDGTTPNSKIDISAGTASDTTNAASIAPGAFIKTTSGAWTSGTGNAGMGNGLTVASGTWYNVCLANNGGTPDYWFDTSTTCANRPAGISDTKYRVIGMFRTCTAVLCSGGASTNIAAFKAFTIPGGVRTLWNLDASNIGRDVASASVASQTRVLKVLSVPTGFKVRAYFSATAGDSGVGLRVMSPDEPDWTVNTSGASAGLDQPPDEVAGSSSYMRLDYERNTDTSAQVAFRASSAITTDFSIWTRGWDWDRGMNGN